MVVLIVPMVCVHGLCTWSCQYSLAMSPEGMFLNILKVANGWLADLPELPLVVGGCRTDVTLREGCGGECHWCACAVYHFVNCQFHFCNT